MAKLPRQLAALLDATTFPHETDERQIVETHISWIVLTGPFAYKVKKPVDLGFVDYSTLAHRRQFCHDELRLNRRLSPEIYLDVVRLVNRAGTPTLECDLNPADDSAIEYAVKMRQFDQSQLLSCQLNRRTLPLASFEQLGQKLAKFHHECEVADPQQDFGDSQVFAGEVGETLDALQSTSHLDASNQAALTALRKWFDQEFHRLESFFNRRKKEGHIRECHGDLHCGNMLVEGDRIMVFDGIEFNEHFRWIDTLNDLAFAWMDLYDQNAKREASRLLNRYLEASGDYQGLAAWRLFVANRALVRAKVTALRCDQLRTELSDESDSSELETARRELSRYVDLANEVVGEHPIWMGLTSGVSGSGKSFIAHHLCDATGAVRIRSDIERKRISLSNESGFLTDESRHQELPESDYSSEVTTQVYDRLATLARSVLQSNLPVVLDATFLQRERREVVIQSARELGVPFLIMHVDVDPATALARLQARQEAGDRTSDANQYVVQQQRSESPDWAAHEKPHTVQLRNDGSADVGQLVERIIRRLDT